MKNNMEELRKLNVQFKAVLDEVIKIEDKKQKDYILEYVSNAIDEAWRIGRSEVELSNYNWMQLYRKTLIENLSKEEKARMNKTHRWQDSEDFGTDTCFKCGLDSTDFENCPQYCDKSNM